MRNGTVEKVLIKQRRIRTRIDGNESHGESSVRDAHLEVLPVICVPTLPIDVMRSMGIRLALYLLTASSPPTLETAPTLTTFGCIKYGMIKLKEIEFLRLFENLEYFLNLCSDFPTTERINNVNGNHVPLLLL